MDSIDTEKIRAEITLSSDIEPLKSEGELIWREGGFLLCFCFGDVRYTVGHSEEMTVIDCAGEHSYRLSFGDEPTRSDIDTPFGSLPVCIVTKTRTVNVSETCLSLDIVYDMTSGGETERREVNISARWQLPSN